MGSVPLIVPAVSRPDAQLSPPSDYRTRRLRWRLGGPSMPLRAEESRPVQLSMDQDAVERLLIQEVRCDSAARRSDPRTSRTAVVAFARVDVPGAAPRGAPA